MELVVYKKDGTPSGEKVTLNPEVFGIEPHKHSMYLAVKAVQANQRQGTHKVKNRAEISGGGKKPFRQKGTGRARQGSSRSPLNRGGGSIFGPVPHEHDLNVPSKVKKLARKSALSHKAKTNAIMVIEDFSLDAPKTKEMAALLKALNLGAKKTLFLLGKSDNTVYRSGRNIPTLRVTSASVASVFDILNNKVLLLQKSAVDVLHRQLA